MEKCFLNSIETWTRDRLGVEQDKAKRAMWPTSPLPWPFPSIIGFPNRLFGFANRLQSAKALFLRLNYRLWSRRAKREKAAEWVTPFFYHLGPLVTHPILPKISWINYAFDKIDTQSIFTSPIQDSLSKICYVIVMAHDDDFILGGRKEYRPSMLK